MHCYRNVGYNLPSKSHIQSIKKWLLKNYASSRGSSNQAYHVVISIPHIYSNKTWYYCCYQTFLLSCIYWKWWYVVFDRRAIHVTCTKSPIFFFSHNIHAFELIYVLGEPRNTYLWNASSVVGSCVTATRLIFLLLVLVWQQQ